MDIGIPLKDIIFKEAYEVLIQRSDLPPIRFICGIEDGVVTFASSDLEITIERFFHYMIAELTTVKCQSVTITKIEQKG